MYYISYNETSVVVNVSKISSLTVFPGYYLHIEIIYRPYSASLGEARTNEQRLSTRLLECFAGHSLQTIITGVATEEVLDRVDILHHFHSVLVISIRFLQERYEQIRHRTVSGYQLLNNVCFIDYKPAITEVKIH